MICVNCNEPTDDENLICSDCLADISGYDEFEELYADIEKELV